MTFNDDACSGVYVKGLLGAKCATVYLSKSLCFTENAVCLN